MAFDEGKGSRVLGGVGSACTWSEEGSSMMKGQWFVTTQREGGGETTFRQKLVNTCTTKNNSQWQGSELLIRLERWWIRWASRLQRREYWGKSWRNLADNLYCWHHLYPNTAWIHYKATETWQWLTGLWCHSFSMALFFAFCWIGMGGLWKWVWITWWCISIAAADLLLPRLRLSSNHFPSTAPLLISWLSPGTGSTLSCGADKARLLLGS